MSGAALADLRGLAALAALLLLPGLAVARAPWSAVPFLSASFWVASWLWMPERVGRGHFVSGALIGSAALVGLRLLRLAGARRPSGPVVLVVAAALARLLPAARWPVAPGGEMSVQSLLALLLCWHDGIPATHEPLLPLPGFGGPGPGLAFLAADVALLGGVAAHRAALLVSLAAHGLLQVAWFALLARRQAPPAAAGAAVVSLALAPLPQGWLADGANAAVLCLAFLVEAAALLVGGAGRASAVAAGACAAAAAVCHLPTAVTGVAAGAAVGLWRGRRRGEPVPERQRVRLALAAIVALAAAAPMASRLSGGMTPTGWGWAGLTRAGTACALVAALWGLAMAIGAARSRAAGAGPGRLATGWAGWGGAAALGAGLLADAGRAGTAGSGAPAASLAGVLGLALAGAAVPLVVEAAEALRREAGWALRTALLLLVAGAALTVWDQDRRARAAVPLTADDLAAMEWIRLHTGLLDVVCNEAGAAGAWVPALAERAVRPPPVPLGGVRGLEWGAARFPCAVRYARTSAAEGGRERFRSGDVVLIAP